MVSLPLPLRLARQAPTMHRESRGEPVIRGFVRSSRHTYGAFDLERHTSSSRDSRRKLAPLALPFLGDPDVKCSWSRNALEFANPLFSPTWTSGLDFEHPMQPLLYALPHVSWIPC